MANLQTRSPVKGRHHPTLIRPNNRFRVLLAFLILTLLIAPLLEEREFAIGLIRVMLSLALVSAVYAISRKKRDLIIGGFFALPSVVGRWLPSYATSLPVFIAVSAATTLFLGFVAYLIISEVASLRTVTFDTIFGAGCGYLLIGAIWAFIYSMINVVAHPGFVFTDVANLPPAADLMQQSRLISLFYFSFITLTSTGFGDILPLTPVAKGFAVSEAIIGQFYVAILVARLVSLEILSSGRETGPGRSD
ncbi:MAG TPA: potassium channel family protein [Candidatus Binataceae bacterium]|nr:potassium channel family protein [Candidatus Binataceae bacterium]